MTGSEILNSAFTSVEVVAAIISVILTTLIGLVGRIIAPRGRLKWGVSHQFAFAFPVTPQRAGQNEQTEKGGGPGSEKQEVAPVEPAPRTMLVRTREIWFQNIGRAPVTGIEVVLNYPPQHYEIWPQREYDQAVNPAGRLILKVRTLAFREQFTISMLDAQMDLPEVLNVRWDKGLGIQVPMGPQQIHPRWVLESVRLFLIFGGFSAIYWVVRLFQTLL